MSDLRRVAAAIFLYSLALILFELLLTRIFAVVLFASFAHLALALALLGIGVGAVLQHLRPSLVPAEGLQTRLGWIGLGLGLSAVLAILAALYFPLLEIPAKPPDTFQETAGIKDQLLRPGWFAALLPVLALPFAFAGLAFAGSFQRMKEHIGYIYAADLIGGAIGALIFVPLLGALAGPDAVFVVLALSAAGALLMMRADRTGKWVAAASLGLALLLSVAGGFGELLKIKNTAGFSEDRVVYTRWTALTRLAVFETHTRGEKLEGAQVLVLLDNASASEIPMTVEDRERLALQETRSIVYRLHSPDARVAILAASAGPEVSAAQSLGFSKIDAIDIASEIFDIVAERYPESPVNPYLQPGVRRVHMDGRAAILQAKEPYDIIQMVHANLWSAAGLLANTWSPALLETQEAFGTYLDHLSPDGTISFGRGTDTELLVKAALRAVWDRGVKKPWQAIAYVQGKSHVMLMKQRPWTAAELEQLRTALKVYPGTPARLVWDPLLEDPPPNWDKYSKGQVMRDDRPYVDTFRSVQGALNAVREGKAETPLAALYRSMLVQVAFVFSAGFIFVIIPYLLKGRQELRELHGGGWALLYVACLGYGYLAVETTLVHELVLFVGHPTYAITVVVLTMLLSSGLGSAWVERWPQAQIAGRLRAALVGVLILGALAAWVLPPWMQRELLGLELELRLGITFLLLFPLGFLMGVPFPAAVRLLPTQAAGLVPWCWALNGWMSVVASMGTVLVARLWGYTAAYEVALGAYVGALAVGFMLGRVRAAAAPSVL